MKNNENNSNIILYSDESKNEQLNKLGAGVIYTTNLATNQSFSWNLNLEWKYLMQSYLQLKKPLKLHSIIDN